MTIYNQDIAKDITKIAKSVNKIIRNKLVVTYTDTDSIYLGENEKENRDKEEYERLKKKFEEKGE